MEKNIELDNKKVIKIIDEGNSTFNVIFSGCTYLVERKDWIPCYKKMPTGEFVTETQKDEYTIYLLLKRDGNITAGHYLSLYGSTAFYTNACKWNKSDIIAWMLLPNLAVSTSKFQDDNKVIMVDAKGYALHDEKFLQILRENGYQVKVLNAYTVESATTMFPSHHVYPKNFVDYVNRIIPYIQECMKENKVPIFAPITTKEILCYMADENIISQNEKEKYCSQWIKENGGDSNEEEHSKQD